MPAYYKQQALTHLFEVRIINLQTFVLMKININQFLTTLFCYIISTSSVKPLRIQMSSTLILYILIMPKKETNFLFAFEQVQAINLESHAIFSKSSEIKLFALYHQPSYLSLNNVAQGCLHYNLGGIRGFPYNPIKKIIGCYEILYVVHIEFQTFGMNPMHIFYLLSIGQQLEMENKGLKEQI